MANCEVYLRVAIPPRYLVQSSNNARLYTSTYTGYEADSTNVTPSNLAEWDSAKTDYQIDDRVKIGALGEEYACGEVGNRAYPPSSSLWKKVGSVNEMRYRDGSPSSLSIIDNVGQEPNGQNIINYLTLSPKDNYLFIQNMQNVKKVVVEKDNGDGTFTLIVQRDTFICTSFHPCICCFIEFGYESNFTYKFEDCADIMKIRVTLERIEDKIIGVGICAIGRVVRFGSLQERPTPRGKSDFKFSVEDRNLALPEHVNKYMDYSFKLEIPTDMNDTTFVQIQEAEHQLNFYEIEGLTTKSITRFIGTHDGFAPTLSNWQDTPLAINVYAILN